MRVRAVQRLCQVYSLTAAVLSNDWVIKRELERVSS